tara:strand:+ start:78 stop:944 length:867 start_codon:yes stop_codon:yes gene_type:complete
MEKIAIIANDAGGSQLISSWIKFNKNNYNFSLSGPALSIFEKKIDVNFNQTIKQAINKSDKVFVGTGWSSNHEFDAIKYSRKKKKHVIAFLDHWVNYEERFIRNGERILPDEFWVSDKHAFKLANRYFPKKQIKLVKNYYVEDQLKKISPLNSAVKSNLLYILEPMRNNWGKKISGEFQALDFFFSMIPNLKLPNNLTIRLRLHPSEEKNKYDKWINKLNSGAVSIDTEKNLAKSISKVKWVVGCESFALYLAALAGRKVYSSLPSWAPNEPRIPQVGIINIKDIIKQ